MSLPKISVIIPVYNREKTIEDCLVALSNQNYLRDDYEIIAVDDGSTDRTYRVSKSLADKFRSLDVKLYQHEKNIGLGSALLTGGKHASGEFVTFVPADGQFLMSDIKLFLKEMKNADLVIGYRTDREADSLKRKLTSKVFLVLVRCLFKIKIRDYNWVHMYRKEKFKDIEGFSK